MSAALSALVGVTQLVIVLVARVGVDRLVAGPDQSLVVCIGVDHFALAVERVAVLAGEASTVSRSTHQLRKSRSH